MDTDNQTLRRLLDREIVVLEGSGDNEGLKASYLLMRTMHQRRKVSDLIGLLQESES